MIEFFTKWLPEILFIVEGILINLKYTVLSVSLGLIIAIIIVSSNRSKSGPVRFFSHAYVSFFRGTPLLIQLSIIYFVLPGVIGIKISVFWAALISFSLNSGAYASEIIRSGINSVDIGQFEAADSLGLPRYLTMKDIVLPQAIRKILPALINEMINLLKETAIISIIGEAEILRRAQMVASEKFNYVVPMLTAASCFYIVVLLLVIVANHLEKKLSLN